MRISLLLFLFLILMGCGEKESEKHDRIMSELVCPVILIGKTDKASVLPSIVVLDGDGRVKTISQGAGDGYKMPSAISQSREIGDTLKNN
jgi:hypothetical protein